MPELDTRRSTAIAPQRGDTPAIDTRDTAQDLVGNAAIIEQIQSAPEGGLLTPPRGQPWRAAYGDTLGGMAFDAIDGQLTDDKLTGHAHTLVDTGLGKLREQADGSVKPEDQEAYALFMAELDTQLKGLSSGIIGEGGLGADTRGLVEQHPYLTGGAALAGAAAWWLSDQDLPMLSTSKALGDRNTVTAGLDPGRTMHLGVEQASLGWAYKDDKTQAGLQADYFGKDNKGYSASGSLNHTLDSGATLNLSGSHVARETVAKSRADLGYSSPNLNAAAYWQQEGLGDKLRTVGASLNTTPEDKYGIASHLQGEHRSDGVWSASGGLSQQLDDQQRWTLDARAGQSSPGAGSAWEVNGLYERALNPGETLTLSGSQSSAQGQDRTRLDLGYVTPAMKAAAWMQRTRGEQSVDTFGGSVESVSEDPRALKAYLKGESSSNGAWSAAAGLSKDISKDHSWGVEARTGRDANGQADNALMANWKMKF